MFAAFSGERVQERFHFAFIPVANRCRKPCCFKVVTLDTALPHQLSATPEPMTDQRARQARKPREVTGWGVLLAAAVVAALLATMMLWALEFMNSEFVTPAAHR
jgi:hypothetical protein